MRAAAILGLGTSPQTLKPFQKNSQTLWQMGLPSSSKEADAVLLFGGDGTLHRHLSQLVHLQLPVLVVPSGSGNDFARSLGVKNWRDSLRAWRQFEAGKQNLRAIDLGVITPASAENADGQHYYFASVGGIGLDGAVALRANRLPRWLRAHGGYVLSLPGALYSYAPVRMRVLAQESGAWREHNAGPTMLAVFANAQAFGGGMKIAPQACMDDGQLDVCLITDIHKFKLFCLFPTVYFGRHLSLSLPEIQYFQAERLRLETETPLDVYADGEFVCRTPMEVSVAKGALRVVAPVEGPLLGPIG
jgi:diacylglycerol kinase (ATP)